MYINKLGLLQINVNSFSRQFDYARSLCNYGTIIRQILCNYSIGTNLYIVPNLYITQNNSTLSTNKNVITYCRTNGTVCCSNSNILKTMKAFTNARGINFHRMPVADYHSTFYVFR